MRVITPKGIGECEDDRSSMVVVMLDGDADPRGTKMPRRDVHLWDACLLVRWHRLAANRTEINTRFWGSQLPRCQGAGNYIHIDLSSGKVRTDYEPGNPSRTRLMMLTAYFGVHHWTKGEMPRYQHFPEEEAGRRALRRHLDQLDRPAHIAAHLLFDMRTGLLADLQFRVPSSDGAAYAWSKEPAAA